MQTTLTPRLPSATVRAGLDACRVEVLRDLAELDTDADPRAVRARARVFERVRIDLERFGLATALARAATCYQLVPVVPARLIGRHPAARARAQALERVFEAAGVDPQEIERMRRVRPRFVDDPPAAS